MHAKGDYTYILLIFMVTRIQMKQPSNLDIDTYISEKKQAQSQYEKKKNKHN